MITRTQRNKSKDNLDLNFFGKVIHLLDPEIRKILVK